MHVVIFRFRCYLNKSNVKNDRKDFKTLLLNYRFNVIQYSQVVRCREGEKGCRIMNKVTFGTNTH